MLAPDSRLRGAAFASLILIKCTKEIGGRLHPSLDLLIMPPIIKTCKLFNHALGSHCAQIFPWNLAGRERES